MLLAEEREVLREVVGCGHAVQCPRASPVPALPGGSVGPAPPPTALPLLQVLGVPPHVLRHEVFARKLLMVGEVRDDLAVGQPHPVLGLQRLPRQRRGRPPHVPVPAPLLAPPVPPQAPRRALHRRPLPLHPQPHPRVPHGTLSLPGGATPPPPPLNARGFTQSQFRRDFRERPSPGFRGWAPSSPLPSTRTSLLKISCDPRSKIAENHKTLVQIPVETVRSRLPRWERWER